ncbi:MAG: MFS transporter [Gemmataceae bacterium]|nr:MFS transporter [Gemmataceae bacterium]MDW8267118.1 MFS transporter [Gemmataceae bacterium]
MTRVLVLVVAAIGFLFDTYELLMFPVIGADAVGELIQVNSDGSLPGWLAELGLTRGAELQRGTSPASVAVRTWAGRMLWIAALAGGAFGLLGGWLIDRLGRKTIMVASILLYSLSPVAAAYSTDLWQLVLFRCTTFIGVCVEMVAAVTWLAELFETKRARELAIGWTLATASLGGILVTEAYNLIVELSAHGQLSPLYFPSGHLPHNVAWRYTLLTGLVPGAAILFLMPFVPESRVWRRKKQEGTLRRPRFRELFSPDLRLTTGVTTLLSACGYAAAFGAIQMTPLQIASGLPDIAAQTAEAEKAVRRAEIKLRSAVDAADRSAAEAELMAARQAQAAAAQALKARRGNIQRWQELGGLAGRITLAVLLLFLPSRTLLRVFLVPGVVLLPLTYFRLVHADYVVFATAIFFCGLLTVAQFSFLSELLPRVYPMHLRGTGGSFATNFGGRMLGTMAATLNTEVLAKLFSGTPPMQVASAAGVIGGGAYLIALLASLLLPAPRSDPEG